MVRDKSIFTFTAGGVMSIRTLRSRYPDTIWVASRLTMLALGVVVLVFSASILLLGACASRDFAGCSSDMLALRPAIWLLQIIGAA